MNIATSYISPSVWKKMNEGVRKILRNALPGVLLVPQPAGDILAMLEHRHMPEPARLLREELTRIHTDRQRRTLDRQIKRINRRQKRRR